jgi:hypothetical protein
MRLGISAVCKKVYTVDAQDDIQPRPVSLGSDFPYNRQWAMQSVRCVSK